MAKDDYFVIVYKILDYLYFCLKSGKTPEAEMLMFDGGLFQIHREYWVYIFDNLVKDGYISGIHNVRVGNGYYISRQIPCCMITPKGIEYLMENSMMKKVVETLKDIKSIMPVP